MKTKILILLPLLLLLSNLGAFAQHDHAAHSNDKKANQAEATFKDPKLGKAYDHYIQVKNALVESKSDVAKKIANDLTKALKDISGSTAALESASKIASSTDLGEQRTLFSILSNEMTKLVKGGKLSAGNLYLEYCPMANNNAGAYWLSNEKEIKNPYFGDMMLHCGSVKETIQ
jgi:DNA repair ATPase RecN